MSNLSRLAQLEKAKRATLSPAVRVFGEDAAGVLREWGENADQERAWTEAEINELSNTLGIVVHFRETDTTGETHNE